MSEVEDWLKEIDLEDYFSKIIDLGAKKVKHLKDIEEEHLKEMNMRELEIKRFLRKKSLTFESAVKDSLSFDKIIYVPLPSKSFGHSVAGISEEKLKKTYAELYYISPVNMKQNFSNSYILKMCSASEWRFDSKKNLLEWARCEREERWCTKLSFTKVDELCSETDYFKQQSILYKLKVIVDNNKDIMDINSEREIGKHMRVENVMNQIRKLHEWCEEGMLKIDKKISNEVGHQGRTEEEMFWKDLKKEGDKVYDSVNQVYDCMGEIYAKYNDEFGKSKGAMADVRRKRKNEKKSFNRKSRAEKKLTEKKEKERGRNKRTQENTINDYLPLTAKEEITTCY